MRKISEAEERERVLEMCKIENECRKKGYKFIAGVDEAGRGPLAGPVFAAAVIFPEDIYIEGINDSKKRLWTRRLAGAPVLEQNQKGSESILSDLFRDRP